jgi:hypothetical protein
MSSVRPPFALNLLGAAAAAFALAACASGSGTGPQAMAPAGPVEVPPTVKPQEITGRWGLAAFHKPDDRARTETAARNGCKQPYVIGMGPGGGVMTVRFIDPEVASRYGTQVYVRCAPRA